MAKAAGLIYSGFDRSAFRTGPNGSYCIAEMPTSRVAGIASIVANMSVLFSTRDWSVAGTLSTIAGAGIAAGAP